MTNPDLKDRIMAMTEDNANTSLMFSASSVGVLLHLNCEQAYL